MAKLFNFLDSFFELISSNAFSRFDAVDSCMLAVVQCCHIYFTKCHWYNNFLEIFMYTGCLDENEPVK
jgi:hypothetical protein